MFIESLVEEIKYEYRNRIYGYEGKGSLQIIFCATKVFRILEV